MHLTCTPAVGEEGPVSAMKPTIVRPTREERRNFALMQYYRSLIKESHSPSFGSDLFGRRVVQYQTLSLHSILNRAREPWWRKWWNR